MHVLHRLRSPQYQVVDFEGSSLDLPFMIPLKGLLVMSRVDQVRLPGLLQQVDHVLLSLRGSVEVKGFDPWGAIV
jgi:hypothetical protein